MKHSEPLLKLEQICFTKDRSAILQDISFSLSTGQIMSIIGPNGAGKTTLIRLILSLLQPTSGKLSWSHAVRIAYLPQQFDTNPYIPLSVNDFLRLRTKQQNLQILKRLGIDTLLNTSLHNVSGGELQLILLARAILQQPELLILDEPTQGVDFHGQAEFYELIEEFRQQLGCAVLMISHDLHVVMAKADLILCLNKHICCQGHPQEVGQHPAYINLFGKTHTNTLAVYNHQHDHHHSLQGETQKGNCSHD